MQRLYRRHRTLTVGTALAVERVRYVGDPVHQMVGQDASLQDRETIRRVPKPVLSTSDD